MSIRIRLHTECNGKAHIVQIGDNEVFFSYQTAIAFRGAIGEQYHKVRLANTWGTTTGRHFGALGCKEFEIECMHDTAQRHFPELVPFTRAAMAFVETINSNSDGWAHWKAGHRAASKFLDGLNRHTNPFADRIYGKPGQWTVVKPSLADLRRSMAPMKSLITKHKFPALPTV